MLDIVIVCQIYFFSYFLALIGLLVGNKFCIERQNLLHLTKPVRYNQTILDIVRSISDSDIVLDFDRYI